MPSARPASLVLAAVLLAAPAVAQELNCQVEINRRALTGSEFGYLDELETELERYLNDRAWTDDVFEPVERIDCRVELTFTQSLSLTSFAGQFVVQASRPIYGSASRTTTLRIRDDAWQFTYTRGQNLIYDPNRFDALTSVLDFYANLIVGYDYDTFSELGGTLYFERAQRIAELARTSEAGSPGGGWYGQGSDDRVRSTLIQQILNPTFEPLRKAQFAYHLNVLDRFLIRPEEAYTAALEVLQQLHGLYTQFSQRRYATDVFFGAKYQELTALLSDAPQRNEAYALLSEMDAAHLGTYDQLVNR